VKSNPKQPAIKVCTPKKDVVKKDETQGDSQKKDCDGRLIEKKKLGEFGIES